MSVFRRPVAQAAAVAATAVVAASLVGAGSPASAAVNAFPKVPNGHSVGGTSFLRPGQAIWRPSAAHPDTNYMVAVGLAPTTGSGPATRLGTHLIIQEDGNLVEYAYGSRQVLFTTHTSTAEKLVFQDDHNVVLYDKAGRPLWQTRTANSDAVYFGPYGNGELVTQRADGQFVSTVGTAMTRAPGVVVDGASSPSGNYRLDVQPDGNVVEYLLSGGNIVRAVWNTHTAGTDATRFMAQLDGNLVVYSLRTGKALWSSRTATGTTAYRQLDLQDDGDLVLWTTDGTHRTHQLWSNGLGG